MRYVPNAQPAATTGKSYNKGESGSKKVGPINPVLGEPMEMKPKHQRRNVPIKGGRDYRKWTDQNKPKF